MTAFKPHDVHIFVSWGFRMGLGGGGSSYMKHYTGICRWNRNTFYAPSFETVWGAYCFWGVRPSVRRWGRRGLLGRATSYMKHYTGICRWNRYTFYAPSFEEIVGAYCLRGVRPSVRSFIRSSHFFDAKHNFRTVHATVLKVFKWIHHEKKKKKKK